MFAKTEKSKKKKLNPKVGNTATAAMRMIRM
jgi:hypothetical protein